MITNWATLSTPSLDFRLVKTNGRSPRILRVPLHHVEAGADEGRQIDLVDHQQVGQVMPGPPLRGILSPAATSMT